MESAAGRRAISTLAAKLHPPTPLTHRESTKLLNLLTTSFRNHLDREHPVNIRKGPFQHGRESNPRPPPSSSTFAHDHIDSILSNPLLSTKPIPKHESNSAIRLLEDPVNWFTNEVAIGAADIQKATLCSQTLSRSPIAESSKERASRHLATLIAEWLSSSEMDKSSQFMDSLFPGTKRGPLAALIPSWMQDEKTRPLLWRWLMRPLAKRMRETGSSAKRIMAFRTQLLKRMAASSTCHESLTIFLKVLEMHKAKKHDIDLETIQALGSSLVSRIEREPPSCSAGIYETFINSSSSWLTSWCKPVEAMLWMHHPTSPTPYPGLDVIKNFDSNIHLSASRRKFLVRLSLGVAQRLLDQDKSAEAQIVLEFTQKHFADLVLPKTMPTQQIPARRTKQEKEVLSSKLLDRLLPT